MTESKAKPSELTKAETEVKKPGLQVKPIKDLEPDQSESEKIRGGNGGAGWGGHFLFSDAALKSQVAPVENALVKLRQLRF